MHPHLYLYLASGKQWDTPVHTVMYLDKQPEQNEKTEISVRTRTAA